MTYDRSAIMKAAWTIVRRFAGSREPLRQKLARALRYAWWDVKRLLPSLQVSRRNWRLSPPRPARLRKSARKSS
ncbi:hypothetical protein [Haematobacter genomosp. 1]|uniref:hypothetical protein n=1 Tax=Haematobacter genomosp. 1 TaxID=366618 RepID=UPI00117B4102|nr:hypothetical protein [Haematobacter genomosp. 1]